MTLPLFAFAVIVLAAYAVQTTTGFGSMILCVTLGAHLFSLEHVLSIAVPLSLVQNAYIVLRHRDGIDWKLLLGSVLPLMVWFMGALAVGVQSGLSQLKVKTQVASLPFRQWLAVRK